MRECISLYEDYRLYRCLQRWSLTCNWNPCFSCTQPYLKARNRCLCRISFYQKIDKTLLPAYRFTTRIHDSMRCNHELEYQKGIRITIHDALNHCSCIPTQNAWYLYCARNSMVIKGSISRQNLHRVGIQPTYRQVLRNCASANEASRDCII